MKKYRIALLLTLPVLISLACGSLQNVPAASPPTDAPAENSEVTVPAPTATSAPGAGMVVVENGSAQQPTATAVSVVEGGNGEQNPTSTPVPTSQDTTSISVNTETDYPVMTDSSNVSVVTSDGNKVVAYETIHVVDDVIDFYKEQMTAAGWQVTKDLSVSIIDIGPAIVEFSRGEDEIELVASPFATGEGTGVVLTIHGAVPFSSGEPSGDHSTTTTDFEFPVPEGAQLSIIDVSYLGDTEAVYEVNASTADVVAFYKEQMPAQGFALVAEKSIQDIVAVIFLGFANAETDQGIAIAIASNPLNLSRTIIALLVDQEILD